MRALVSSFLIATLCQLCVQAQSASSSSSAPASAPTSLKDVRHHTFLSAPEIKPVQWSVHIYDEEKVAPGYWFVGPKHEASVKLGNTIPGGSWIGPHIFDGHGDVVWSGSHIFGGRHTAAVDFKPLTVDGQVLLAMEHVEEATIYLLDNHYDVYRKIVTGVRKKTLNTHEFNAVGNGTRFLYSQRATEMLAPQEAYKEFGFTGKKPCKVSYAAFMERDAVTNDVTFEWHAQKHVPLSECTLNKSRDRSQMCNPYWDYMHSNALDKFQDGHYLLSARHTDTLYKISKDDGSVIWRLHGRGGERSDFEMIGLNFSRQHHSRLHQHNDTHAILTLLDNATGQDGTPATSNWSRALRIALRFDTSPMTATLISSIDHPKHDYSFRRGSHQILPNGNTFVCWSEFGLQSEHTPNGEMVMQAEYVSKSLGSYRAFKSEFKGEPRYPPKIYSIASTSNGETTTAVYVSWNGATEVAEWVLYKTDETGRKTVELLQKRRSGFETALVYKGFAKRVYVQAKGRDGQSLDFGTSDRLETIAAKNLSKAAIAAEAAWLASEIVESSWYYGLTAMIAKWAAIGVFVGLIAGIISYFDLCAGWLSGKLQYRYVLLKASMELKEYESEVPPNRDRT